MDEEKNDDRKRLKNPFEAAFFESICCSRMLKLLSFATPTLPEIIDPKITPQIIKDAIRQYSSIGVLTLSALSLTACLCLKCFFLKGLTPFSTFIFNKFMQKGQPV
jgi:hypothetical protein